MIYAVGERRNCYTPQMSEILLDVRVLRDLLRSVSKISFFFFELKHLDFTFHWWMNKNDFLRLGVSFSGSMLLLHKSLDPLSFERRNDYVTVDKKGVIGTPVQQNCQFCENQPYTEPSHCVYVDQLIKSTCGLNFQWYTVTKIRNGCRRKTERLKIQDYKTRLYKTQNKDFPHSQDSLQLQ